MTNIEVTELDNSRIDLYGREDYRGSSIIVLLSFHEAETIQSQIMGDLAADHPAWWRWAYLGL